MVIGLSVTLRSTTAFCALAVVLPNSAAPASSSEAPMRPQPFVNLVDMTEPSRGLTMKSRSLQLRASLSSEQEGCQTARRSQASRPSGDRQDDGAGRVLASHRIRRRTPAAASTAFSRSSSTLRAIGRRHRIGHLDDVIVGLIRVLDMDVHAPVATLVRRGHAYLVRRQSV